PLLHACWQVRQQAWQGGGYEELGRRREGGRRRRGGGGRSGGRGRGRGRRCACGAAWFPGTLVSATPARGAEGREGGRAVCGGGEGLCQEGGR
ncbi:unnamed protein product, partial [Closterium sp. NIES-53]